MRCMQCNTDNQLRERIRNAGRCKNCRHPFVLGATNRPSPPRLTDVFFQRTIANISANGSLSFTRQQLFYHLNRRLQGPNYRLSVPRVRRPAPRPLPALAPTRTAVIAISVITLGVGLLQMDMVWGGLLLGAGILAALGIPGRSSVIALLVGSGLLWAGRYYSRPLLVTMGWWLLITGAILLLFLLNSDQFRRPVPARPTAAPARLSAGPPPPGPPVRRIAIAPARLETILSQWELVNGAIPMLASQPWSPPCSAEIAPDLKLYSFDLVLICDSDAIAQFLIANNFHFERNCPVLSIHGYPQSIFSTLMTMLRRNPELKVYALHSATVSGVAMAYQLRTSPDWFAHSSAQIYDLGLSPHQVFGHSKMFVRYLAESTVSLSDLPEAVQQMLTADERRWLAARRYVELESFLPRTLLQIVMQSIAASRRAETRDSASPPEPSRREEADNIDEADRTWQTAAGGIIFIDADGDDFG